MAGFLAAALPALAVSGANTIGGLIGQGKSYRQSKKLAKQQYGYDMEMMKYQLDYNSPANQMKRFKDAGLNPNLVYGQGSAGNLESPPRYPDVKAPDYGQVLGQVGTNYQQARLMSSQADLVDQKVEESGVKQSLMKSQQDLIKANPHLRPEYVNALVTNLSAAAAMKKQESDFLLQAVPPGGRPELDRSSSQTVGYIKMDRELQMLFQKFDLGSKDQQIKGQILQSKEFQNALQQIQLNWMKDGEITSQHIYLGIMMLLQKLM